MTSVFQFKRRGAFALCLAALILAASGASAQTQSFPNRPLKIIVPFGPGSGSDVIARSLAQKLSETLRQQVVVENREGAGGVIGTSIAAKSAADGYTLLMAANPFTVAPALYGKPPYDPLKDFMPVAQVATVPNVLLVHPSLPSRTVRELIALAKAKPGTLNYASSGKGTPSQLEMELLKVKLGIDLQEIPYKSTAQAMTDLVGGQLALYYPTLTTGLPQVRAGRLRALAVGSPQRSPAAPDIPTMAEALGSGFEAQTWYGLVVPAGTPREIVARLSSEITRAMQSYEVATPIRGLGAVISTLGAAEFGAFMQADMAKWHALLRRQGIRIE